MTASICVLTDSWSVADFWPTGAVLLVVGALAYCAFRWVKCIELKLKSKIRDLAHRIEEAGQARRGSNPTGSRSKPPESTDASAPPASQSSTLEIRVESKIGEFDLALRDLRARLEALGMFVEEMNRRFVDTDSTPRPRVGDESAFDGGVEDVDEDFVGRLKQRLQPLLGEVDDDVESPERNSMREMIDEFPRTFDSIRHVSAEDRAMRFVKLANRLDALRFKRLPYHVKQELQKIGDLVVEHLSGQYHVREILIRERDSSIRDEKLRGCIHEVDRRSDPTALRGTILEVRRRVFLQGDRVLQPGEVVVSDGQ